MIVLALSCVLGRRAAEDSAVADTADPFCADVPVVTYNNFGEGFLLANCQSCHASTAPDRHDAPEEVSFDTVDQVWTWAGSILATATGDAPKMPPRGGIDEADRVRLEWWLRCAEPGT